MTADLTEDMPSQETEVRQRALAWLAQFDVSVLQLTRLKGLCNYVFLVEQSGEPRRSILRLANNNARGDLCPLAHQSRHVISLHYDAAALGLSPSLLAVDESDGIMWMRYGGEEKALKQPDFTDASVLLKRLHRSQLPWPLYGDDSQKTDPLRVRWLEDFLLSNYPEDRQLQNLVERMLEQETRHKYSNLPLVPTHGDLNPSNFLYDGERWWIIDWDFAGLNFEYWDYASVVTSHHWNYELTANIIEPAQLKDLPWFCCHYELLSRDWHLRRGSDRSVIHKSTALIEYWSRWLE